jgi:HAMP domain-containing protein
VRYMRIPENKFWGWVLGSIAFGLVIGLAIMLWRSAALGSEITTLQHKVDAASTTASTGSAGVQAQLAAAEASITALTDQNTQLQTQLATANNQIATLKGTSKTSSTTTSTIAVTSRSVSPSTVATSGTLTLTAKVTGHPTSVTMRVYNTSKSYDKTYTLRRVSTSGNSETWRLSVKAPTTKGTFHYYATAIKGSVRKTMAGASPGSFTVH